nr:ataxin-7-like protein 3 isoform X2 [Paramormyrops kingsleyae]
MLHILMARKADVGVLSIGSTRNPGYIDSFSVIGWLQFFVRHTNCTKCFTAAVPQNVGRCLIPKLLQMTMEEMTQSDLDNTKLESVAHDILMDLVEDACLGLCFEVHRAVKQGYFLLDETDVESMKDFEIVDRPGVDIFGQVYNQWKNKECVCPNCERGIAASRFAPHLEKCLGMGRNSSRIASRRIASSNNVNRSESDQEDNDDLNDNDWSYGSEKKTKKRKSDKNSNSPRRSKSLKHKNGELGSHFSADQYRYHCNSGINYETLGPDELRSLLMTQCGVVSEHTKRMCTRSLKCPQHTDEQRRAVRLSLLGPAAPALPDGDAVVESDSYEATNGQQVPIGRLHWGGSSDVSPSDSTSSKASTNNSVSTKPKKKKPSLSLSSAGQGRALGGGFGALHGDLGPSNHRKKNKHPVTPTAGIYEDMN